MVPSRVRLPSYLHCSSCSYNAGTGELPYTYQDGVLNEEAMHALLDADDALARFTADETLFGPLASDPRFARLMRDTVAQLEEAGYVSGH